MSASQWAWCVRESAYGTTKTSPTAGTDSIYLNLPDSNAFNSTSVPVPFVTPYGGGFDVGADLSIDHHNTTGKLTTLLYPDQAAFWLGLAVQRINSAQDSPFVTTEPPGDLASFVLYHAIKARSGTITRHRFPGGKVNNLKLSASRSDPRWKVELDFVFQKQYPHPTGSLAAPDATEFPLPTEASYPSNPYLFSETVGEFKRAGTALSQYQSIEINIGNALDPLHFESPWLSTCGAHGRSATINASLLYKTSPDHLTDLQAGTSRAFIVKLTKGTKILTINFNGANHVSAATYNLGLGKEFIQDIAIMNKWDRTALSGAGDDVTYTYASS